MESENFGEAKGKHEGVDFRFIEGGLYVCYWLYCSEKGTLHSDGLLCDV